MLLLLQTLQQNGCFVVKTPMLIWSFSVSAHETGGDHLGSKGIDSWRFTRPGKGPSDGNKHLRVIPILMQPHVREPLSRKTVTGFFFSGYMLFH